MQAICHQVRSRNHTRGQQAFCPACLAAAGDALGVHAPNMRVQCMLRAHGRSSGRALQSRRTCCFMLIMVLRIIIA